MFAFPALIIYGLKSFSERDDIESKIWEDELNARIKELDQSNKCPHCNKEL